MKCKIALGMAQKKRRNTEREGVFCVWSKMYYSDMSRCAGEMRQAMLFTNLCQFVKLDGSMSGCLRGGRGAEGGRVRGAQIQLTLSKAPLLTGIRSD